MSKFLILIFQQCYKSEFYHSKVTEGTIEYHTQIYRITFLVYLKTSFSGLGNLALEDYSSFKNQITCGIQVYLVIVMRLLIFRFFWIKWQYETCYWCGNVIIAQFICNQNINKINILNEIQIVCQIWDSLSKVLKVSKSIQNNIRITKFWQTVGGKHVIWVQKSQLFQSPEQYSIFKIIYSFAYTEQLKKPYVSQSICKYVCRSLAYKG
ncbi:Hypothetical_protein [Hexamita inflata]|uniref:Hypothetical_protein n=1 Tax=Hexamita inflata TaxID=28002 RepID=A0AA86QP59_9EUKA|nr:Hypothetical protein HINF_LOCUS44364 [Hexamita inflata]